MFSVLARSADGVLFMECLKRGAQTGCIRGGLRFDLLACLWIISLRSFCHHFAPSPHTYC